MGSLGHLKEQETISSTEVNIEGRVQGHDIRSCQDVVAERSIDRAKIGSRA
jgi:hypothetical protein